MSPQESEKIASAYGRERKKLLGYIRRRVPVSMEPEDILQGGIRVKESGISLSEYIMPGLGGKNGVSLRGARPFHAPVGRCPEEAVAGIAGTMYTPINSPNYHMGMDFLVLSFVVVVVGGMGSLPGAVLAGFLLGILESFASLNWIKDIIPGIDQIIIYLIAIVVILTRPRGLMGRKGVMEN